jgi:CRP/FNR family transcriptional regulator
MSREIRREEHVLMLLGTTTAEQRIARFLVNLYDRLQKRGEELNKITLFMSRQDIGNYLGLAIETVSRQFRNLQDQEIIRVDKRDVYVLKMDTLLAIAE